MATSLRKTPTATLRDRLERGRPRPLVVAALLSVVVHAIGAVGLSQLHLEATLPETPDRVLTVEFVSQGQQPGDKEVTPDTPDEPAAAEAVAAVSPMPKPPRPAPPAPPSAPSTRFPALARAAQGPPPPGVTVENTENESFEAYQQRRMARFIPAHIPDGGGDPDGRDAVTTQGRDKCEPMEGRRVDRLFLLYDSSGSMSPQLRAQALSCAQQYAKAVIDGGGSVVVGNFARSSKFSPATRDMTDVALSLRADNDPRYTFLPSRELNPFFDEDVGSQADLVILSDGVIPNYREVLPWYRYFLEMNPDNRGYLYTLGTPGHPEVTAALREIGFDIYVYRIL